MTTPKTHSVCANGSGPNPEPQNRTSKASQFSGEFSAKKQHAMCLLFPTTQLKLNNFNYWSFIILGCYFKLLSGHGQLYCTPAHATALAINNTKWIQHQTTSTGRDQVKDKHPSRKRTKLSPNSHMLTVAGSHGVICSPESLDFRKRQQRATPFELLRT